VKRTPTVATLVLLAAGVMILRAETPPANTPPAESPEKQATTEELKQRVIELAVAGKLTDELVTAFREYSLRLAKDKLSADVPRDFWTWLAANRAMHDGLLAALHPSYDVNIVKRLQELREKFGKEVDTHTQLALAFAVVFGRAGGHPPWGSPAQGYLRNDRTPPTMEESFAYYLKYEKVMKYSLRNVPWLLLAYIADNETPIAERLWALNTYAKSGDARLRNIYNDVRYDWGKIAGNPRIGDRPRNLPNIREFGGVCAERAYYSSRIFKSFGIPSMYTWGVGRDASHAWVTWIKQDGKYYDLDDTGRYSWDNYYTGYTYCPLLRKQVLDRDVQLLAVAVGHSYDEYLNALIACHAYEMLDADKQKDGTKLLKNANERNPFCERTWHLLAQACVDGVLTHGEGEELFNTIAKALTPCPDLTCDVLEKILAARLQTGDKTNEEEIKQNLAILDRAFLLYGQVKRPDLAVRLCMTRGSYLESLKRNQEAFRVYVMASEKYAKEHYGVRDTFDATMRLMDGPENLQRRLAFCEGMVKLVPRQRSGFQREANMLNPPYVHVVRAYIRTLQAAGRDDLARQWEASLIP
jgi:hypothetical protein